MSFQNPLDWILIIENFGAIIYSIDKSIRLYLRNIKYLEMIEWNHKSLFLGGGVTKRKCVTPLK